MPVAVRGLASLAAAMLVASCASASPASGDGPDTSGEPAEQSPETRSDARSLAVAGARLTDAKKRDARLLGVNHAGAEYMCIQGRGIFDSPADDALVSSIAAWNVNVVRLGLNEHCWNGIGGLDPRWSGQAYRDAIRAFVGKLRAKNIWVVLEVHWSSSFPGRATRQQPMLDRANGLPFWRSVAATFEDDLGVVFDAYNEPFLDVNNTNHAFHDDVWECWRLGCVVTHDGETYVAAGMQPIVDEIRGAGAKNVIMLGGLDYANDLSGMLSHLPNDPAHALAASAHVYATNRCNDEACWDATLGAVAAKMPLVTGEVGETDCAGDFVQRYMRWADARRLSYLGWTFNPGSCSDRPSLVSDWSGTPTPYGAALHDHLAELAYDR